MALFIAGSAIAVALLAADVNASQERQLLDERAGELSAILNVSISESRSVLLVAGSAPATPDGAKTFDAVTAGPTLTGATVGVVSLHGKGLSVVRSAGKQAPANGARLAPDLSGVVRRAVTAGDMVSGVIDVAGTKHIVLALAMTAAPDRIVYLDSPVSGSRRAPTDANSPYRELDVAVYASRSDDPSNLVGISGKKPGSHGPLVHKQFAVGTSTWSLAVSAHKPLIGSVAVAFPAVLAAGGLLTAIVLGLLIETLVRRREYALKLVDERTRLLQDAQAEAERANQAREEFFASVSHDIRAPLTAIMGFTEMMSIADAEQQEEFVQRVRSNVATLGVMVDNMLDHARLQAGALEVQLEPLCLSDLVEDCLRDLEPVLTTHKITVTGAPFTVMADRLAFGRVLANILINAVRYSPVGSAIDVELSADHLLGRVTIADRGRGIEEKDLKTIFDEFSRGSSVKGDGGSGLGLFSVHQLVTEQLGTVGISSTPGEGTTVTIELPRVA
ncbi:MAG: sensor histidine kinase [Marmoricola sp.]